MKIKAASGIMLTLLLTSILTLAFSIQPVRASGTIYIRADGSVDPPTAPILRDGELYTFIDDIYDEIVVERDNIVVDGAGYTLQGAGDGIGIDLTGRSNVAIRNVGIKAFTFGVWLYFSRQCTIRDTTIGNNRFYGVWINVSIGSVLASNVLINNGFDGLGLWYSNDTVIGGNSIRENQIYGMRARYSNKNTISNNEIANNKYDGIWFIGDCNNNSITGNLIANHSKCGIEIWDCRGNVIYHNNFFNNTNQAHARVGFTNVWDDGYPSGGNYWSDHVTVDEYSGVYQNETGSDGIVDKPYIINEDNKDRYPPTEPWAEPTMIKSLMRTIKFWDLPKGTENSLEAKLKVAIHMLDMGEEDGAIRKLTAFINRVEMLREKTLTNEQADQLISEAQTIIDLI